jgi:arsenate reductase
MAEGFLNAIAGEHVTAYNAGSEPTQVHPAEPAAMADLGVDITGQRSKSIEEFAGVEFLVADIAHADLAGATGMS